MIILETLMIALYVMMAVVIMYVAILVVAEMYRRQYLRDLMKRQLLTYHVVSQEKIERHGSGIDRR